MRGEGLEMENNVIKIRYKTAYIERDQILFFTFCELFVQGTTAY